jgi:hypothetical protein
MRAPRTTSLRLIWPQRLPASALTDLCLAARRATPLDLPEWRCVGGRPGQQAAVRPLGALPRSSVSAGPTSSRATASSAHCRAHEPCRSTSSCHRASEEIRCGGGGVLPQIGERRLQQSQIRKKRGALQTGMPWALLLTSLWIIEECWFPHEAWRVPRFIARTEMSRCYPSTIFAARAAHTVG